jgi:hypothetical protein
MSCVRHETALRDHAHGAPLSPALEAHLESCTVCQEVVAAEQRLLSEIDRALDGIGRVEPSPTFLARARSLDRPQRLPPSGRLAVLRRWPVWALPALAGALLIAALAARSTPPFATRHPPAPATASPSSTASPLSSEPLRPAATHEPAAATRPSLARPPSSEPAAIVPPGQADALVRLASLIATGAVAPPALLLEPPDPAQEIRQPAELNFRPLTIAPIVDEGDTEGDML